MLFPQHMLKWWGFMISEHFSRSYCCIIVLAVSDGSEASSGVLEPSAGQILGWLCVQSFWWCWSWHDNNSNNTGLTSAHVWSSCDCCCLDHSGSKYCTYQQTQLRILLECRKHSTVRQRYFSVNTLVLLGCLLIASYYNIQVFVSSYHFYIHCILLLQIMWYTYIQLFSCKCV